MLKNQWKMMLNSIKTQPGKNYVSYGIVFAVLAMLLLWLSMGIWFIHDLITEPVFTGMLSYGFLLSIGLILLLGMPQVFKQLYSATDLNLLFTMPIPTRIIFWVKYLQSFAGIPLLVFVFLIIPVYVYGAATGVSWLYYPVVMLVLIAFVVIGLSLAYLANLLLVQIIPAAKASEFMTVMSLLSGLLTYGLFMLPTLLNERPLSELILEGLPLFPEWAPVTWGSQAIIAASAGSLDFLLPFLMILTLAAVIVMLTLALVEKGFRTGWVRLNEGGGKKQRKGSRKTARSQLHHPAIAVGKKEWLTVKRDMREWLVFMPLVFFLVFGFVGALSGGADLSDLRGSAEISWPIAQVLLLFMYAMFNGQLAASAIAREALSIWLLRVLPLSGRHIALGKLWISWLLSFLLLTVIEIIIGLFLGWSVTQFLTGIAIKAVITTGISSIGIWFGTIGAKYNPSNPQNRLTFGTSFMLIIVSFVYLFVTLIPFIIVLIPVDAMNVTGSASQSSLGIFSMVSSLIHTLLSWKAAYPVMVMASGIILMAAVSLGIAYLFIVMSARRLDQGIEIDMVQSAASKPSLGNKSGRL
ncbi:putative ABC transporter permease subunit [Lentibacillus kimchii]|uniref:ABC-2 type transport system permease protein n=1 Tax=Lentibacillus kimchii TaxID=1542911 RepID=A0ABW2UUS7_9BACI